MQEYVYGCCAAKNFDGKNNGTIRNYSCCNTIVINNSNNVQFFESGCCTKVSTIRSTVNIHTGCCCTMCLMKMFVTGGNVVLPPGRDSCCLIRVDIAVPAVPAPPAPLPVQRPVVVLQRAPLPPPPPPPLLDISQYNLLEPEYPPAPIIPYIVPPFSPDINAAARQQILRRLPEVRHEGVDIECVICLVKITPGEPETFLVCFHSFHSNCIRQWFNKNLNCPNCQTEVLKFI